MKRLTHIRRRAAVALVLWIAALQSPAAAQDREPEVSRSRFAALWTSETSYSYSEPELLVLVKDTDPLTRQYAVLRLAELDPPSEAAMAALTQALGDPVDLVRFQALSGLIRLGRPAMRELAKALSDLEPIAEFRYDSMARYGERSLAVSRSDLAFATLVQARDVDVDALLTAYRSAPPEERISLVRSASPQERIRMVLERMPAQVTPSLVEALQNGDIELRISVASMMSRAGVGAVPFLARVVEEDSHTAVRKAAAFALAKIPEGGHQVLRGFLRHANPQVRSAALAAYPADASDSAELVASLLKDPKRQVRRVALGRIGTLGWLAQRVVNRRIDFDETLIPFNLLPREEKEVRPGFLADLADSVLSEIVVFSRDSDAQTRRVAAIALGSLGSARPDLAPAAADALAAMLIDSQPEIAHWVIYQLYELAKQKLLPRSPEALDRLLAALSDPANKKEQEYLLIALENMDLPEARRKELIDVLLTVCLNAPFWDCDRVKSIVSSRPGWLDASIEALLARYPDAQSFDVTAWSALEDLGSESPIYRRKLEELLGHREKWLRVRAAVALAKRGYAPARVWQVLEEGALSFGGLSPAKALAGLGEQGIARLIAGLQNPATESLARETVISFVFSRVAAESSSAADFILAAAADPSDSEVQKSAIQVLRSIQSRADEVRTALAAAFLTGNTEVRRLVVYEWKHAGLDPGELVARVFADPMPDVRAAGFDLLALLPQDDPRRLTFTAAALRDQSERVRGKGLLFAGELGEPGSALLAQYAARDEPLTTDFFDGVARLDSFSDELIAALEARMPGASPEVRNRIVDMLGRAGFEAPVNRELLYAQLESSDAADREHAARALLSLAEDPWAREGLIAAILMEAEVRRISRQRLGATLDRLYPDDHPFILAPILATAPIGHLEISWPHFPWPPPPGYRRPALVVPRELVADSPTTTFGELYRRLVGAIEAASPSHGFAHGLFLGPADGFVLVARMERIERDGTPLPEPARWMKEGSPKLSLLDLMGDLFFEKPGYFRVIVFAVTGNLVPGQNLRARLYQAEEGAPGIPAELASKPFRDKEVLALIYTFERRRGARIRPWEGDGAPTPRQHLELAGVWTSLAD